MNVADLPRGAVVLVAFPFTDLTVTKIRPALVLSEPSFHRRTRDVILAAISSVVERGRTAPTRVLLAASSSEFAGSGLRVTSVVHCGKIVTVQGTLLLKLLGALGAPAMGRIDAALRRALGLGSPG